MFHHFQGELTYLDANIAVIDCGGVGYALTVSAQTAASLSGKQGQKVFLFAQLQVREDAMELFGFSRKEELQAFKQLLTVSGVGPKAAVGILSVLTVEQFVSAVHCGDSKALSRAPGVGAKTAARIVLDLKDKVSAEGISKSGISQEDLAVSSPAGSSAASDAANALLVLGFSRPEIHRVLSKVDPSLSVEEMIREALKLLNA